VHKIAAAHAGRLKIAEPPPGPPTLSTIVAEVYGRADHSYDDLAAAGRVVRARMQREPGVVDVVFEIGETSEMKMGLLEVRGNVKTKDKIQTTTTPSGPSYGGYYGYRSGYYGVWNSYDTQVTKYTEGTLTVDVVDAARKQLVWDGTAVGRVREKDRQNLGPAIDRVIAVKDGNVFGYTNVYLEGDRVLVTAYAILTLQHALRTCRN
jgi:hypothetical protein